MRAVAGQEEGGDFVRELGEVGGREGLRVEREEAVRRRGEVDVPD